jgi:DNA polymerase-4
VRYDDFTTVTRSQSVPGGVSDVSAVTAHAHALLDRTDALTRPVRLLGVSVHNLVDPSATFSAGAGLLPFDDDAQ